MELHKLLRRQLSRIQLSETRLPDNMDQWIELITRLNKSYIDADNDRYLLERSMNISSAEMMTLNEKLERAQHIAGLGYWHYDLEERFYWSKELYTIFNHDPLLPPPSYQEFLQLIHTDEQDLFQRTMEKAKQGKNDNQCEIRVKIPHKNYRWFRMISQNEKDQISGIFVDIHKAKETEEKINELNQQLLITARQAGMSEIATSILHNVGNVLNSASVSVNILINGFSKSYYQRLNQIFGMLKKHSNNLNDYLTTDEKGKLIPEYLLKLSDFFISDNEKFNMEINNIYNNLRHIKDIVSMQQSISGMSGIVEKVFIPESIETAIKMSVNEVESKFILVSKKFSTKSFIHTDKSKLLQILINLIKNAKDSLLLHSDQTAKEIEITIEENDETIDVCVTDNGMGINPENINRIFSFGFTTKETGHGFGLHSSALSAQEMGVLAEKRKKAKNRIFFMTSSPGIISNS